VITLKVELPKGEQAKLLRLLSPKRFEEAEAQALNRTANNVQKFGLELVSSYMGIPKSKLNRRGRSVSATKTGGKFGAISKGRRASRKRLATDVLGVGRPFNVTRFNATVVRSNKRQTGVTHRAWGVTRTLEKVWMLVNKPGRPVVVREGKSFRGVYGPGVGQVLDITRHRRLMERHAQERFEFHMVSRLRYKFGAK